MHVAVDVIVGALELYLLVLIVRMIFDWVFVYARSWRPAGPLVILLEIVYSLTDPPLRLLRRFIPPLRLGQFSLDLAFLVLYILIYVLISAVSRWGVRL
jgi:YggT family protein